MNIYVGNLSFQTTESELTDLFKEHGDVESVKIIQDYNTGRSKGFGFVIMNQGGDEAIEALNGKNFQGKDLVVNVARAREDKKPDGGGYRSNNGGGNRSGGGGGYDRNRSGGYGGGGKRW